ncbi:hypothetical protein GF395_03960 [Candidatus Uhrbacteria bacterium]|nr:hypothetical protein [Candidatus Uhrbacteria bacterium]
MDQKRPRTERKMERIWIAGLLGLVIVGLLIPTGIVEAGPVAQLINTILLILAKVLEWIIYFVGRLVILLVDVIIQVAQYNHFIDSTPVQSGWPLVRDVTNMFFVVILLALAFGTIVQYQKLHYSKYLPKLLLMAVLVNFSLTLIGVLIDFSQVLMLTFVNGFKAAAGGNFVEALKLNQIMTLGGTHSSIGNVEAGQTVSGATPSDPNLLKVVIAEMLAIFFLGITVTMLLIMLVYLLVRIVGLWIALILSPLALMLTAVPDFIKSKVGAVADDYWNRLGALLAGGPMMAFFLWLTLATVQGEGFTGFDRIETTGEAENVIQESGFASAVANVEDVATFFVAIIMLLMGVDAAIRTSQAISPAAGALAGKIKSTGVKGAKFAAYGGLAAAGGFVAGQAYRGGRYVAGKAGRAVGGAIDRRLDVTGRAGRGLQRLGASVGSTAIMGAGAKVAGIRPTQRRERAQKIEKGLANLTIGDKISQLEKLSKSRNVDKAQVAQMQLAKISSTSDGIGAKVGDFKKEAAAKGITGEAEQKAYAEKMARQYTGTQLDQLEAYAKQTHDEDALKVVRERREGRPDLITDREKKSERISKLIDDGSVDDFLKNIRSEAYQDSDVVDAVLKHSGMLNDDGSLDEENDYYKKIVKKGGMSGKIIQDRVAQLQEKAVGAGYATTDADGNQIADVRGFMSDGTAMQNAGLAGAFYVRQRAGEYRAVATSEIRAPAATAGGAAPATRARAAVRTRNAAEINAGRQLLNDRRDRLAQLRATPGANQALIDQGTRDVANTQAQLMMQGATMQEATRSTPSGTFESEDDARAFGMTVQNLHDAGETDVNVYNNVDFSAIQQNPQAQNQSRKVFVQNTSVDQVRKTYQRAQQQENAEAANAAANMAKAIDLEGTRIDKRIAQHAKDVERKSENKEGGALGAKMRVKETQETLKEQMMNSAKAYTVAANDEARQAAQQQLQQALQGTDLKFDIQDAVSLLKKEQISKDDVLRNIKKQASGRSTERINRMNERRETRESERSRRQNQRTDQRASRAFRNAGVEPPSPGGTPPTPPAGGTAT